MDQFDNRKQPLQPQEANGAVDPSLEQNTASSGNFRSELRESVQKVVSADAIEIVAGQTVLDPITLKKMFLLGKLTQGQLAYEMKKFNDVKADSDIKDGKQNSTQVIDYRQVGRASVSNPGGDFKTDQENNTATHSAPKDAKSAKREAASSDNDKVKKELEKKQVKLKDQENLITNRKLNNFTEDQANQKNQHASREAKKREEEKDMDETNPLETSVDRAAKVNTGRPKLTKNLAAEIKKELEKAKGGPGQASR